MLDRLSNSLKQIQGWFHPDKARRLRGFRDIKSKPLRYGILSFLLILSLVLGLGISMRGEEEVERGFRDQVLKTTLKGEKVGNWNLVARLPYKGKSSGIYSYQSEKGLGLIWLSTESGKTIDQTIVDTEKKPVSESDPAVGLQLLLYLIQEEKLRDVQSFEFKDSAWKINGESYEIEIAHGQIVKVNGVELSRFPNVFLTQPAVRRLAKSYGLDLAKARIGRVTIEGDELLVTARDLSQPQVYEFRSKLNGEVSATENKLVRR